MAGDDDVGLHVLGCRVDILGTNCKLRQVLLMLLLCFLCLSLILVLSKLPFIKA